MLLTASVPIMAVVIRKFILTNQHGSHIVCIYTIILCTELSCANNS